MTAIPQYLTSIDPEVIATIERNGQIRDAFYADVREFARKYSADENPGAYAGGDMQWGLSLSAIESKVKPTSGQWTRGYRGQGWRPFKNNPAYAEMRAIGRKFERIPGLPSMVAGPHEESTGREWWLYPTPFIFDGAAWQGFSMLPADQTRLSRHQEDQFDPERWTEVLASVYHAAKEDFEAENKARRTAVPA